MVGTPYIHRAHQIPGVIACWKHARLLLDHCTYCGCPFEREKDLFIVPWKSCVCRRSAHSMGADSQAAPSETAIAYARFTNELLNHAGVELDAAVLVDVYRQGFIERGFVCGKNVSRQESLQAIEKFYGNELLSKMDTAYRSGRTSGFFHHLTEIATFDMPLSRHLVTAFFLFRETEKFWAAVASAKERIRRRETDGSQLVDRSSNRETTAATTPRSKSASRLKEASGTAVGDVRALKELEEIQAANPEYRLGDYWKNHYGLIKRLLRADPLLFDAFKLRLDNVGKGTSVDHHESLSNNPRDVILAGKLERASAVFYQSADKPLKVTRYALLKAAGVSGGQSPDPKDYPLSTNVLQDHSESQWHFHARRIVWAMLKLHGYAPSASKIIELAIVNHYRGLALLEYFSGIDTSQSVRKGTIQQILTRKDVKREWSGPRPDEHFYSAGRAYVKHALPPKLSLGRTPAHKHPTKSKDQNTNINQTISKRTSQNTVKHGNSDKASTQTTFRRSRIAG